MNEIPSWLDVSRLIEAYGDDDRIPERIREWRREQKPTAWSLETLASKLDALAIEEKKSEYALGLSALSRIETGKRNVSINEAVALCRVLQKPLMALLLPEGAIDEAEDWRMFEQAAESLNDVRHASREYERIVSTIRLRLDKLPYLKKFIESEHSMEVERDELAHRANYDRRVEVKSWLIGTPLEETPMEPYEEWRAGHFLSPTPKEITAEHVLGKEPIDADHWYLGWEQNYVRNQFRFRIRLKNPMKGTKK